MLKVGKRYQLDKTWLSYPKGLKVKLLCIYKCSSVDSFGGIIAVPNKGFTWNHDSPTTRDLDIIDILNDYPLKIQATHIPLNYLIEIDNNDFILNSLAIRWSAKSNDSYNKFREEFLIKNGYDIHKNIYS